MTRANSRMCSCFAIDEPVNGKLQATALVKHRTSTTVTYDRLFFLVVFSTLFVAIPAAAQVDRPSRLSVKGCAWEKIVDAAVGLEAWVQRCDFGFRKIDFLFKDRALAIRYSDGGAPDPLVEVIDLLPAESQQAGVKRAYAEHTDKALAARCMMLPYRVGKLPAGAMRYVFAPNPAYRKELKAKASPDEVGDPPCGDWGVAPDGIQYFEVRPADKSRRILFVRVGQDVPLFDEQTLRPIGTAAK